MSQNEQKQANKTITWLHLNKCKCKGRGPITGTHEIIFYCTKQYNKDKYSMDCFLAAEALRVWSFKLLFQCSDLQCLTLNHVLVD